jgi:hypothetical protein
VPSAHRILDAQPCISATHRRRPSASQEQS